MTETDPLTQLVEAVEAWRNHANKIDGAIELANFGMATVLEENEFDFLRAVAVAAEALIEDVAPNSD